MAWCAHKRGHTVFYIDVNDLVYYSVEPIGAHAREVPDKKFTPQKTFMAAVKKMAKEKITSSEMVVLMLRNDPHALSSAVNKMYFQHFPEMVRPKTIITREVSDSQDFFKEARHKMVIKPLQGSGGH